MSFNINSDKEKIKGVSPQLIGENETTIRIGSGSDENEVFRAQKDPVSGLPRIGINRTGKRVNAITVNQGGSGYTVAPAVTIDPPPAGDTARQALGSAILGIAGEVSAIVVTDSGDGYTTAPNVIITGGNGVGAVASSTLDTVDFELDINGAIRTSTSIISDTARVLNLDIDNFVTPDLELRAPNLKTFANNTGVLFTPNDTVNKDEFIYAGTNLYQALNDGKTGGTPPTHKDGIVVSGNPLTAAVDAGVQFKHIGYRVNDPNSFQYNETGNSGIYPRSITPLLGDRSDKIATTEYVLNLATNDVGGRVYVSEQIGSDLNDGRSAVAPVRSIKKAAQIAWSTPGVKETLIVAGGDYTEDNPISLPPDCSVVGDNLRLVIIRPGNPGKDIFKFGDKNYVTGVTYRDQIDSQGLSTNTWRYAMVFDDKQRVVIDNEVNGDFGVNFPIGHQIIGPQRFRLEFTSNTGGNSLASGIDVVSQIQGARARTVAVTFDAITGQNAFNDGTVDVEIVSGGFSDTEPFTYYTSATQGAQITGQTITQTAGELRLRFTTDPTTAIPAGTIVFLNDVANSVFTSGFYEVTGIFTDNAPSYWDVRFGTLLNAPTWSSVGETFASGVEIYTASTTNAQFTSQSAESIRAEGEVVSTDYDVTTTLPISRIDFSLQGDASIATGGFQEAQFGSAEDLGGVIFYTNALTGADNTHDFKEGQEIEIEGLPTSSPDLSAFNGKQRIYKVLEDADGRSRRFVIPKKFPSLTLDNFDPGQFAKVKSYAKSITLTLRNSPNKFPLSTPEARRYQDACQLIRNNRAFIADEVVGIINREFAKEYYSVYNLSGSSFDVFIGVSSFAHTYVSGGSVTFGGSAYTVTDFVYDNAVTGVATITTSSPISALSEDDTVKLSDILVSCTNGQKTYPSFSIPTDDEQCRQDVEHFLNALVRDLEFGTNHNIVDAAEKYIVNGRIAYIENEIIQNVRAVEYARELAIWAMANWRTGTRLASEPIYTPRYTSLPQYFDDTVITTTANQNADGTASDGNGCSDVASAIDTLAFLWVDVIANNTNGTYLDAAYLISRNKYLIADQAYLDTKTKFADLGLNNVDERKCRRDIGIILNGLIRDLSLGGNAGILTNAEAYYTGNTLTGVPDGEIGPTRYAFKQVARYATAAMRNWTGGNFTDTTPNGATYNPASGQVTVTFPDPVTPLTTKDRIAFKEGAITFNCSDNGGGSHASPERFDSNFGKDYAITNVNSAGGNTTVTCTVPTGGTAQSAHTFVSALTDGTVLIYDTVETCSAIPKFVDWNILLDSTAAAQAIKLITPTTATYDPATGDFVITSAGHGLTTSDAIRLAPESFVFTCAMDGNKTEHYLPEVNQPAYGTTLAITAATTNTFTVNVGASGPDVQFTPTGATYDPATGLMVLTIGSHTLSVGEGVVLDDNSFTFTCDMDNDQSQKTYPRPGIDPFAGKSIPIAARTDTTITLDVGKSASNKYFTPSAANYDPITGDLTLTVGQHGLGVGRSVVLEDNSLTFLCDYNGDNYQTPKTYPRPGQDPFAGQSIAITAVGSTGHTPTDVIYDPTAGDIEFVLANHGFVSGDYVLIEDDAITLSCTLDNNATNHTYPRSHDYASGRWFALEEVTTNTFKIKGLPIPRDCSPHTFVSFAANGLKRQDGTFTINVGSGGVATSAHTFVSATTNAVKHEPQSAHTFISASANAVKHLPQSAHTFKRVDDNAVAAFNSTSGGPACSGVEQTIDTEMDLLDSVLRYASDPANGTQPGSVTKTYGTLFDTSNIKTYPDSFIYDTQGVRMAVRADFDDFPIIEASPYTQNASVISALGGGGAEVDGNKVKQPNSPFPGLEPDGSATFPNQGKSMVAAAFTVVSQNGTGYMIKNDGYVQLVSVFCIFCKDGVIAESGGYASITNSATNFGQFALRANGFRAESYTFDRATIQSISQTAAGRTTLTVAGLGRAPLEHYILKIPGYRTQASNIEYFIDAVGAVSAAAPYTATITVANGDGNDPLELIRESDNTTISGLTALQQELTPSGSSNATLNLHRPSIVNSSSHTWEYAGAGTDYNALPENGGTKIEEFEQVDGPNQNYGRVYVSGTDELGDFKVGTFARIENRTGAITFTGTVTISEVEFLKLKGGTVVVTGFSSDNTLGGANTSDSKLPTQKAVRDFITNNLGAYINKPYSTNAVPRSLVELTDSGKISLDQIPALRPFSVFTVADQAGRLALEGALAGDIAIQQDTQTSFILNNDNDSLFLGFAVDPNLAFTIGDLYTGTPSGGVLQATEYRTGVVYQINITNGGAGYTTTPSVTISGGNPASGAVSATAECSIASGQVVSITVTVNNGYLGGFGYTTAPTVTIAAPPAGGTLATASALIESRLYGDIINNIKIADTDTIADDTTPTANVVNITRSINTSSSDATNWVSLSAQSVNINDLTSTPGNVISSTLLGTGSANSFSFLRGDTKYAPAVQTVKGTERRYFGKLYSQATQGSSQLIFEDIEVLNDIVVGHDVSESVTGIQANTVVNGFASTGGLTTVALNNPIASGVTIPAGTFIEFFRSPSPIKIDSINTKGDFVAEILIANAGTGYTQGDYRNVPLTGTGVGTGTGLEANIIVGAAGTIDSVTITNGGENFTAYQDSTVNGDFTITTPAALGPGNSAVLEAKTTTSTRSHGFVGLDVDRVTDATISADPFGTSGVARFLKSQFIHGSNGSITIKDQSNTISSGLDADLLDGLQGTDYLDGANFFDDSITPDKMQKGVDYDFNVDGSSGSTDKLNTINQNPSSNPDPFELKQGLALRTIFDTADGLATAYPSVVSGNPSAAKHLVMSIRTDGNSSTIDGGGVRQLAFGNDDNIYLRGSGATLNQWSNWYKLYHNGNDGINSGLDADRLDNKQGTWYQEPFNLNAVDPLTNDPQQIWETHLPRFLDETRFRNKIRIRTFSGTDVAYAIFFRKALDISSTGQYKATAALNLYDIGDNNLGNFTVDTPIVYTDANDSTNNYTILKGRLSSGGTFTGATALGTANDHEDFDAYALNDNNIMYEPLDLGNDSGNGYLRIGRRDNQASNPYIDFNSSAAPALDGSSQPTYNARIEADGGNATEGSGSLRVFVNDENSFTVNNSIIWNASNVAFNSSNVLSTASLKSAVMRDTNGDFSAGTITAALTGAASDNVLKTGDTMSGLLTISGLGQGSTALDVDGEVLFDQSLTVGSDLLVDNGTLFVDASTNKVRIGDAAAGDLQLTVGNTEASLAFQSNSRLGNQQSFYNFQILKESNSGEAGLVLRHGSLSGGGASPAEWGISVSRQGANVGDLILRTRTGGSSNEKTLTLKNNGDILPEITSLNLGLPANRWGAFHGDEVYAQDKVVISDASGNNGAELYFKGAASGAGGGRSWRMGNALSSGVDVLEIAPSVSLGAEDWNTTNPTIAMLGQFNRVGINTNSFGGTDTTVTPNVNRVYTLNVNGDVNIDGQLFQNNAEFVTSRWNEVGNNIYRNSRVGVGETNPAYTLDVGEDFTDTGESGRLRVQGTSRLEGTLTVSTGGIQITGTANLKTAIQANGHTLYADTKGIITTQATTIDEDVTIPSGVTAYSIGDITIASGRTVVVNGDWSLIDPAA